MVHTIDMSNESLIYIDTISNFFYYLKYRHIGESTKGKIQSIIPKLKPDLRKYFKYIISDLGNQIASTPSYTSSTSSSSTSTITTTASTSTMITN